MYSTYNRNNKKMKNILKFFAIGCVLILFIVGNWLVSFGTSFNNNAVYADSIADSSVTNTLFSNPTFNSSSDSKIANASSYSEISYDGIISDSYKKGIVDTKKINETLDNEDLWDDYGLVNKPGLSVSSDSTQTGAFKYLMINNPSSTLGRYGYKTSTNISLVSSAYYSISINVKTLNNVTSPSSTNLDAFASIYLDNFKGDTTQYSFENIQTGNGFVTYTFYIKTSKVSSESLSLELWLGGDDRNEICNGAVFFTTISAKRYSEDLFNSTIASISNTDTNKVINLSGVFSTPFTNSSFETGLTGWTLLDNMDLSNATISKVNINPFNYTGLYNGKINYNPETNNSSVSNNSALLLLANETAYIGIKSPDILIKAGEIVRLSIWASSNSQSGSINITLSERPANEEDAVASSVSQTVTTTVSKSSTPYTNGWIEYVFFIKGNATIDKNVGLELSIGSSSAGSTGYAFFDDVRIQSISSSEYSSGISNTTNYSEMNLELSSSFGVTNGFFNVFSKANSTLSYPLTPADWTLSGVDSTTAKCGIINTNSSHFNANKENYGNASNPMALPNSNNLYNNVLMLGSTASNNNIVAKSSTFTISKNTYSLLSFYASTDYNLVYGSPATLKIITESGVVLHTFTINSNQAWSEYKIYLESGFADISAYIEISFTNATGYIYFDEFMLDSTNITSAIFNSKSTSADGKTKVLSLLQDSFDNSTGWNISGNDLSFSSYGVVDTTNFTNNTTLSSYANPGAKSGNNILYIYNGEDSLTTYTRTTTYTLTSGTYYSISIWVATYSLSSESADADAEYGARFQIAYGDTVEGFENINTAEGISNGYKKYTIYICPSSDSDITITVSIGLGNSTKAVSGVAYFDEFSISSLADKSAYETALSGEPATQVKSIISTSSTDKTETDSSTSDTTSNADNSSKWLAITSLITAIALIVALVGALIRRFKFKGFRKAKIKNNYDRRKTLDKDLDSKERIELREQLIATLKYELLEFEQNQEKLNSLYKEKEIETAKLIKQREYAYKYELDSLETELTNMEKQHNSLIAENKLSTTKEQEKEYAKKVKGVETHIAKIESQKARDKAKIERELINFKLQLDATKAKIESIKKEEKTLANEIELIRKENKQDYSNYREERKEKRIKGSLTNSKKVVEEQTDTTPISETEKELLSESENKLENSSSNQPTTTIEIINEDFDKKD